mmetsp:Transcript_24708/g.71280  ORF Transcript_24708/g.71280 Transcript_24708/m.71280 type:complete len:222 (+) Transcript_24708:548-1213(+)
MWRYSNNGGNGRRRKRRRRPRMSSDRRPIFPFVLCRRMRRWKPVRSITRAPTRSRSIIGCSAGPVWAVLKIVAVTLMMAQMEARPMSRPKNSLTSWTSSMTGRTRCLELCARRSGCTSYCAIPGLAQNSSLGLLHRHLALLISIITDHPLCLRRLPLPERVPADQRDRTITLPTIRTTNPTITMPKNMEWSFRATWTSYGRTSPLNRVIWAVRAANCRPET